MTIPQTNFNPPFNITRASHLVFTARDLAASRDFYTEVMGLIVSDEDANTIWLRGVEERCHHSLTLKRTDRPAAVRARRLPGVHRRRSRQGQGAFRHAPASPRRSSRCRIRAARCISPIRPARRSSWCATMPTCPRMHTKIHTHRGAGALRMDHYQVLVPDVLATAKFYMDLGFRISDYICIEGSEHVVGNVPAPQGQSLGHRAADPLGAALPSRRLRGRGDRGHVRACDVAGNLGFGDRIEHGPGRHGHQHSYYLYVRDPDGHRTELLLPGIQIIDIDDEPVTLPGQPEGELEPVGAAGAADLGRGGDEFRRRRDQAPAGRRRADDGGEISRRAHPEAVVS